MAAEALGAVGAPAKAAVPGLLLALKDRQPEVRYRAVEALGRIGLASQACVSALIEETESPAQYLPGPSFAAYGWPIVDSVRRHRIAAIHSLGLLGPQAKRAVPRLTELLGDSDWHVRHAAAQALGTVDVLGEAIRPLGDRLADEFRDVRNASEASLVARGQKAVPMLRKLVAQENQVVRRHASMALQRINDK